MSLAQIGSSVPAASGQLPSRKVKAFDLGEYCRRPGVQALYSDEFLVVFVHAPLPPQKIGIASTS
jgi:hypothetical protein